MFFGSRHLFGTKEVSNKLSVEKYIAFMGSL